MKTAVVLLNLGGPEEGSGVTAYLEKLMCDPAVIRLPLIARNLFAFCLSRLRASKTRRLYAIIGGGSSLRRETEQQARALQRALENKGDFLCCVAMRYARPSLEETVGRLLQWGADTLVYLPMYPQFSTVTTGSGWNELLRCAGKRFRLVPVWSYAGADGFVYALARRVAAACQEANKKGRPKVIFSAHALPLGIVRDGDPYPEQCRTTATAVMKRVHDYQEDWVLSYQSRMSPIRWLGPFTEDEVTKAAQQGRPVVVVPLSFTVENLETRVDLDLRLRQMAFQAGAPGFFRIPTVGETPEFIAALTVLVGKVLAT